MHIIGIVVAWTLLGALICLMGLAMYVAAKDFVESGRDLDSKEGWLRRAYAWDMVSLAGFAGAIASFGLLLAIGAGTVLAWVGICCMGVFAVAPQFANDAVRKTRHYKQ